MMIDKFNLFLISLLLALNAGAQERQTYFVDGFHGGVYGHYPLNDFTQYMMDQLEAHTFTTYSTEEPCFTSCLPQILHQLGFRHAVLKCPDTCWGGYTEAFGGELVNWIGPDGTSH